MADTPRTAMAAIREWRGGLKVLVWIGGVGVPLAFGGIGFVHGQTIENAKENSVQAQQIKDLKERGIEDRAEQRQATERINLKLDRLLERMDVQQ